MSHGNGCADGTRFHFTRRPQWAGTGSSRVLDPSGMKREGYARSSAKRFADCEFRP